jgi:hypothetical protein
MTIIKKNKNINLLRLDVNYFGCIIFKKRNTEHKTKIGLNKFTSKILFNKLFNGPLRTYIKN